ncbi:poly(3-hydroxybutyrate) depolymerase [Variovorax sp. TBS-050B]|uniref:extracellular catalytic domain type 2 short-chain-length polyhydroxyalkanoate depolymerase n=1 Tax=Variovorax sp. TBS-050B TaxID=2940551 RepID=UPI00247337F1|nr:PHB depolymerase family esterase [Variovorax sp. TBS-050B]MDH6594157.1 poly(3-hydroxybutyrate) depolymerase [Variovorax sp. TBS-050B]
MPAKKLLMNWKGFAAAAAVAMAAHTAGAAVPLPALGANPAEVSVSGLSAGGFMAVQLHVAYSATFKRGAGIVAGGPYYCAEGSVLNATGRCMTHSSSIPVSSLVSTTNSWAANGTIDPVSNLASSKVYMFSGTSDNTVKQAVMDDLKTYYQSFVPAANTVYKNNLGAGHAMVTDDYGAACGTTAAPYINNCGFDLAGEILKQIYGPLNPRNNGTLGGSFTEFNQSEFISGHGMAATGWIYVPQACTTVSCRVHLVLHGCKQNYTDVGDQYVRKTGYNRWADTNNIVLVYPQTSTAAINSCWDWWGYDSLNYAKKSGPQMMAMKAMIDRLTGSSGGSGLPAPTGVGTSGATSTSMVIGWAGVSGASGYNVYRGGSKVNASPVAATSFTDTGLAPSTSYSWTVAALDANNVQGAMSAAATGTTTGGSGGGTCYTTSNYTHTIAGRAYALYGFTYAYGSGQAMGLWNIYVTTTLKETAPGYYVIGSC